jgi:hypothetical protein
MRHLYLAIEYRYSNWTHIYVQYYTFVDLTIKIDDNERMKMIMMKYVVWRRDKWRSPVSRNRYGGCPFLVFMEYHIGKTTSIQFNIFVIDNVLNFFNIIFFQFRTRFDTFWLPLHASRRQWRRTTTNVNAVDSSVSAFCWVARFFSIVSKRKSLARRPAI